MKVVAAVLIACGIAVDAMKNGNQKHETDKTISEVNTVPVLAENTIANPNDDPERQQELKERGERIAKNEKKKQICDRSGSCRCGSFFPPFSGRCNRR